MIVRVSEHIRSSRVKVLVGGVMNERELILMGQDELCISDRVASAQDLR